MKLLKDDVNLLKIICFYSKNWFSLNCLVTLYNMYKNNYITCYIDYIDRLTF